MNGPFESWPPPPADHRCSLQWDHPNWNKLGEGKYVLTREIREQMHECMGIWPLLDETHGVPKLLDRNAFVKYCFYAYTEEELQAFDPPPDYIPMDYETDEASIKEYRDRERDRRMRMRLHEQYWNSSIFDIFDRFPTRMPHKKIKQISAEDAINQAYVRAVKSCNPDGIEAIFAKGTDDLCPNCLELRPGDEPNMRRGVVAYAMENLFGPGKGSDDSFRAKAIECLRLVCSMEGVDVNADTWFTPSTVGPPLATAAKKFDAEVARILLEAGARTTYPDITGINGQWCNLVEPSDYPEHYQTALHICIGSNSDASDEEMSAMLTLLIGAGKEEDVLVEVALGDDPDETMSALEMLEMRQDATEVKYPTSIAILKNAIEACASKKSLGGASIAAGYERKQSDDIELKRGAWAQITNLDKAMQQSVSQYMDIYQWSLLKRTSKSLASWPKPPPPSIDYHLIRFCIHDRYAQAHSGIALTLSAVLDAFKLVCNSFGRGETYECIELQFLRIAEIDQPIIPLVQFHQSIGREHAPFYYIHHEGARHFGIEEAGKDLPRSSVAKRLMKMDVSLWNTMVNAHDHFEGLQFDGSDDEGAFAWFEGIKPSREIDLEQLWLTSGRRDGFDMHEIWINKGKVKGGRGFIQGNGWAICGQVTHLTPY